VTLRVGWIGLGRIGLPMARRVLAAGQHLRVFARARGRADTIVRDGATWAASPQTLAGDVDIVATIVTGPDDVRDLHASMFAHARAATLFVDMTTASPDVGETSSARAAAHGLRFVDAPITGGVAGASQGTLTAFAGGDVDAIERARPLLDAFCARVVHCGGAGAGYRMKLVNQAIVAGTLLGLANGAALAHSFGFDPTLVGDALRGGTASSRLLESYLSRMMTLEGETTFTLGLLRKDLRLARDEAARHGHAAYCESLLGMLDDACARHGEDAGVHTLAARGTVRR
jgi:3-hydroxyisobutyrate dehydrogenase-like beta-hydroxyacid dehydrogenase